MPDNPEHRLRSAWEMIENPREAAINPITKEQVNIELLRQYAEDLPIEQVPMQVLANNDYFSTSFFPWRNSKGRAVSLGWIVENWERAKGDPLLAEHVKRIQAADVTDPIWHAKGWGVIDGYHRIARAYLDDVPTVPVIFWDTLPDTARIYKRIKDE